MGSDPTSYDKYYMPSVRPEIIEGQLYHVINRGVEKRVIFNNDSDYLRFIQGLREFNDSEPVTIWESINLRDRIPQNDLVEICGFCLMPNHFHLLLRPLCEGGLSLFMQKNGAGYTGYYNLKYERVGSLFQGKYKLKLVDSDVYARQVFGYVHLNPVEFIQKNWKEGINDWSKTEKFLKKYRWSSFANYFGDEKDAFPIVDKNFFFDIFDDKKDVSVFLKSWSADELVGSDPTSGL